MPRQRLLEKLDAALGASLTLLSAPAGFGKTILVAEWLSHRALPPPDGTHLRDPAASPSAASALHAAWLTLDSTDNDPIRFWHEVAGALLAQDVPGLGAPLGVLMEMLDAPHTPSLESVVETMVHALEQSGADLVIVLDDYQQIRTQPIHDTLHFVISHLPARVHLLMLTRADPPLPLQRWRVHGQLLELRAQDLCFSHEEVGAMLSRSAKIVLTQETIDLLVDHTDGWPAGLHLLAASFHGRSAREVDHFVASFAGSNRFVLDYLLEEVLQNQPLPVRDFLLRTSILTRFCAPLCDELLRVEPARLDAYGVQAPLSSAYILHYLESSNLFLVPLDDDRRWYRYYHLFAEALNAELNLQEPALVTELHRRAAQWYAHHGFMTEAIDHALIAQDWEHAGDMIGAVARRELLEGDFASLYRWTDALPAEVIEARPRLAVTRGWLLLFRGPLQSVQSLVDRLADRVGEVGLNDDGVLAPAPGEPVALRAMLAAFRWEVKRTLELCAEAERLLPPEDVFSRAAVHQAAGVANLVAGECAEAEAQFRLAAACAMQLGSASMTLFPLFRLCQTHIRQGRLQSASQIYRRHLQEAHDRGGGQWPVLADGLIGMADVLREQNDLLAAEHYVRRGLHLAPARNVEVWAWGRAVRARISQALGRRDDSALELHEGIKQAIEYDNLHLAGLLRAVQARLDLAAKDLDAARLWAQGFSSSAPAGGYQPVFEEMTLARFYLADHRPRAALALLDVWLARAESGTCLRIVVEAGVLRALALAVLGQRAEALEALHRAVLLAEPENMQRLFLDEGERLAPLLEALAATSDFAARLLASLQAGDLTRESPSLNAPLDRLTPRELEILRALARGASNQQVAEAYVLTVGTVKGHVNHILSKLGARNRTEAVARGRELGLL